MPIFWRVVVALVSAVGTVVPPLLSQNVSEKLQLVLKQPLPSFVQAAATFSPDERYVMIGGLSDLVVYDVLSGIEMRRFSTADTQLPFLQAAFGSSPGTFDVATNNGVLQCDLPSGNPCTVLPTAEASKLTVKSPIDDSTSTQPFGTLTHSDPNTLRTQPINTWLSPSGKVQLFTRMSTTGQIVLCLTAVSQGKPIGVPLILGGNIDPLAGINFYQGLGVLEAHGLWTHYWNFRTASTVTYPEDSTYSASGAVSYTFVSTGAGSGYKLYRQENEIAKETGFVADILPSWVGTSAKGEVLIFTYPSDTPAASGLHAVRDGKESRLDCSSTYTSQGSLSARAMHPSIDPSGQALIAFCNTSANLSHPVWKLIAWSLPDLKEKQSLTVETSTRDFAQWASIAPDGNTVALGSKGAVRIADLTSGSFHDVSFPFLFDGLLFNGTKVVTGEIQEDGKTLVLVTDRNSHGIGNVIWFDTAQQNYHRSTDFTNIRAMSTDGKGAVGVLTEDNIIHVLNPDGKRVERLISIGNDWMVFSDTGFFDATPNALKWVSLSLQGNALPVPAESLFNELYRPGLFRQLTYGQVPSLPNGIDISVYFDAPGIRALLQGRVTPRLKDGKAALCFGDTDLFQAFERQYGTSNAISDADAQCGKRIVLSNQDDPATTVNALQNLKAARLTTPWDGEHITQHPAHVHLLGVAISHYSNNADLGDIPTAVHGVKDLQQAIASTYAADQITLWGDKCNGLYDDNATKARILKCMDDMTAEMKPDDLAIIVFAGHGGNGSEGAMVSDLFSFYTARDPQAGVLGENSISAIEFADRLRKITARRVVFVMDACESGLTMAPLANAVGVKMQAAALQALASQKSGSSIPGPAAEGVLLMAASSGVEDALTSPDGNPFLKKLKDSLKSQPGGARSYSLATDMALPLSLLVNGTPEQNTPLALAIGADFSVLNQ